MAAITRASADNDHKTDQATSPCRRGLKRVDMFPGGRGLTERGGGQERECSGRISLEWSGDSIQYLPQGK